MSERWTEADLRVITEAVTAGDDQGMQRLEDHFLPRGRWVLTLACQAADRLATGRAVEAGDGVTLSRDIGNQSGRVLRAIE